MGSSDQFLNAADAARRVGVSAKALWLYEQRGLIAPIRTAAGWRTYGPVEMERASEIVALRALGFSLAQVARVFEGDSAGLEPALGAHQQILENRLSQLVTVIEKIGGLRKDLARGKAPTAGELARLRAPRVAINVAFNLPWPWGGERFELERIRPLNYITGPLGSGKTRFAKQVVEALPDAAFIGLDRLADASAAARARMDADPALKSRVDQTLTWLLEDGAVICDALIALVAELESDGPAILVVDMIEQALNQSSQEALMAHLRRRPPHSRPLFLLTRSNAILDLTAVGPDEAIILCPANHSAPVYVAPYNGTPGYEAVATCLASPEVRARTHGVVAWRPEVA
jgi:DNA-binding transcriptional MerR regulator